MEKNNDQNPQLLRLGWFPFSRERGYLTVDDALADIGNNLRQAKAQADGAPLVGSRMTGYQFFRNHVVIEFSNLMMLEVWVGNNNLEWRVGPRTNVTAEPDNLGNECIIDCGEQGTSTWRRKAEFEKRIGADVWMLDAGDVQVRLYLHGYDILCFDPVVNENTGKIILYWWEDT